MIIVFLCQRTLDAVRALAVAIIAVWCWRWLLLTTGAASQDYLYRALDTRADELLVGGLLAVLVRAPGWRSRLASIISAPYLVPSLIAMLFVTNAISTGPLMKYGFTAMVQPPLIALLLLRVVVAAGERGFWSGVVNQPLLVHVGQISYGIYLFHGIIGYTAVRVTEATTGSFALGVFVAVAANVVWASIVFRYFETPLRRWIAGPRALVPRSGVPVR